MFWKGELCKFYCFFIDWSGNECINFFGFQCLNGGFQRVAGVLFVQFCGFVQGDVDIFVLVVYYIEFIFLWVVVWVQGMKFNIIFDDVFMVGNDFG